MTNNTAVTTPSANTNNNDNNLIANSLINQSSHKDSVEKAQYQSQRSSLKNITCNSSVYQNQGSSSTRLGSAMRSKFKSNVLPNSNPKTATQTPATQRNQYQSELLSNSMNTSLPYNHYGSIAVNKENISDQLTNMPSNQQNHQAVSQNRRGRGDSCMSSSRRLASQAERESEENARIEKEIQEQLNRDPLTIRKFTSIQTTSNTIQVQWNHPSQVSKEKKGFVYELQYGIGAKVNGTEQFRKIYQGRAHRCIITDLNPKTNYRFRVAAIQQQDKESKTFGEWCDPITVQTKDLQNFDPNSFGICAQYANKNPSQSVSTQSLQERVINFTQAGTIISSYGYTFGDHLWSYKIKFEERHNLANADLSGIMIVGVLNKKSTAGNKIYGSIINYTLTGSDIDVKIYIDANKRSMTIYSTNKPEGEIINDLPKDGIFYPAIQNKTQKFSQNAKLYVSYRFDLPVPQDKQKIRLDQEVEESYINQKLFLNESSSDLNDNTLNLIQ
eukprot:403363395